MPKKDSKEALLKKLEDQDEQIKEYDEQLKEYEERIKEYDRQINVYDDRTTRLRNERVELRCRLDKLKTRSEKAEADLAKKNDEIEVLKERVEKQAITIKVQSEKIARPRETNTPKRTVNPSIWQQVYNQPPPGYNQPSSSFAQPKTVIGNVPMVGNQYPKPSTAVPPTPNLNSGGSQQLKTFASSASTSFTPPRPNAVGTSASASFTPSGPNTFVVPVNPGPAAPNTSDPPTHRTSTPGSNNQSVLSTTTSRPATRSSSVETATRYRPQQRNNSQGAIAPYQPMQYPSTIANSRINSFPQPLEISAHPNIMPTQTDVAGAVGALAIQGKENIEVAWSGEFTSFFNKTETWARNYTNVPHTDRDKLLPDALLSTLQKQSHPELVDELLGSDATRYFLVAKILNSWISNDILRPQVFHGFSHEYDKTIWSFHEGLKEHTPVHVRAALMVAAADLAREMRNKPEFQAWMDARALNKARILWARVRALYAVGKNEAQAWDDMVYFVREAHRVSILMAITPLSYRLTYPVVGPESFFNPRSMLNRDNEIHGDPVSLEKQHMRVRLGISPVVVVTSFIGTSIAPRTVHYSNVLLRR